MFPVMLFCVTKNSLLLALYELDTGAFVSLFCENKNRPQLKCNGQCKLTQMAKEQEEENASKTLKNLQQEICLYYLDPSPIFNGLSYSTVLTPTYARLLSNNYSFIYLFRTDKPPRFLS